jgi:multimeric flavodoxin WrbA
MKIIAISGSPRRGGNTETALLEALEGAGVEAPETALIRLNELTFRGCQGCYGCRAPGSCGCVVPDELQGVYRAVAEADVVLLGSPVYYGYVSGQMKSCLDRWYAFKDSRRQSRLAPGKKAVFFLAQGASGEDHYLWTTSSILRVLTAYGFDSRMVVLPNCEEMGAIRHRPGLLEKAREAGRLAAGR